MPECHQSRLDMQQATDRVVPKRPSVSNGEFVWTRGQFGWHLENLPQHTCDPLQFVPVLIREETLTPVFANDYQTGPDADGSEVINRAFSSGGPKNLGNRQPESPPRQVENRPAPGVFDPNKDHPANGRPSPHDEPGRFAQIGLTQINGLVEYRHAKNA